MLTHFAPSALPSAGHIARRWLLGGACAFAMAAAQAQVAAPAGSPAATPPNAPEQVAPGANQKIERIHIQDKGATVDELRVGGRTESISVKPSGNMPSYQVLPKDAKGSDADGANGGARVWNVLKF